MNKGPKLNNVTKKFTSRDNLGIESVSASIQRELCPVINTVTPRAFYWIFMVWNYYDYLMNSGIHSENWNLDTFDRPFLKKNDYYFVLSNIMNPESNKNNLVGKDKAQSNYRNNPEGPYEYDREYFVSRYGGMQYYNAGCLTMGFITDVNNNGEKYKFPRLTEEIGKPMAIAFENVIKNTKYYKNYRLNNTAVPKNVVEEFGKIVSLDLKGFNECKELLKKALFTPIRNVNLNNKKLIESAKYIQLLHDKYNYKYCGLKEMRKMLFDYFSPRGEYKYCFDDELKEIITDWEVVVGRQYFTISVEMIWKYMLAILDVPMQLNEWLNRSINTSKWNMNINENLSNYIESCNYNFDEREKMIEQGYRGAQNIENNIESAMKILLSLYNRFKDRRDVNEIYLEMGGNISLNSLIQLIEEYKERPVYEIVVYIMENWIVEQHKITAFNKMVEGRDGYYFECIDGDTYAKKRDVYPDFQGIRMIQLNQVMKDLDMWSE